MQKIDACGMLAQWPVSWGAAPKAEGPLSTNVRRSAPRIDERPLTPPTFPKEAGPVSFPFRPFSGRMYGKPGSRHACVTNR